MRRLSRSDWVRLVAAHATSGLTHEEFARQHRVLVTTLRSWIYRVRRERAQRCESPALVPVRVVASAAPTARGQDALDGTWIEVALPSGVRLRFPTGTDDAYVAALARRLG